MSRKLDVAIAEALGYEAHDFYDMEKGWIKSMYKDSPAWRKEVPSYSTAGIYMLELIKEMQDKGYLFTIFIHPDGWKDVSITRHEGMSDINKGGASGYLELPELVSKACYQALTGKERQDD